MRSRSIGRQLAVTASLLALCSAAPAWAQANTPGVPEASTQDDDPAAAASEDRDSDATAAESASPLETGSGDNPIVVTGSRIARPEFSFPYPVQAFTSETIQQAGTTNLTDFLVDSPALRGSTTNTDVAGSNLPNAQYVGVNLLNLRYLGAERTLVLVNGRRHIAGYPGVTAVDINTIPVDLIDRVDILTGGTSAVYGSDGVSGVVNFVLKRDFEGLSVRGQASVSQRGDAANRFVSATWGSNFADERGNFALSYEFNELDRFSQRKRLNYGMSGPTYRFVRNAADFPDDPAIPDLVALSGLRWADTSPGGAIDIDGDFVPDFNGDGTPYDVGSYVRGSAFTIGGSSTPQDSYFGDYTPYSRRHIANAFGHFEIAPALRLFAEAKYVKADGYTLSQPVYDFYTYLEPDNAFLIQRFGSAAPDGAYITGRDHFDFGIRRSSTERDTYRAVAGADGRLGGSLRYELSYTFGQVDSTGTSQGDRYKDRYFAAIDAVVNPANGQVTCRINLPGQTAIRGFSYGPEFLDGTMAPASFRPGECVPLNLMGEGAPSREALDWVLATHSDSARIRHHVVSAYLAGDTGSFFRLQGGPVGLAAGAEYRHESSRLIPSEQSANDLLADSAPSTTTAGSFAVKEAFAEINVPILADLPFAQTLSAGAAYRISDYTTTGTADTWSLNAVFAPVRDIVFRATYSQAVRAPNVTELFAGTSGTYEFIADPCGIDRLTSGTQYRAANCASALTALGLNPATFDPADDPLSPQNSSILGISGGNPDLQAETAKTWTAGLVLRPRFIPGLNIALDWYDIRLKNAVNTPAAQELVELCYDQPTLDNVYCDAVGRNGQSGYIDDYRVGPENVAAFDTEGLDLAFNYRFAPLRDFGNFNLKVNANYLHKLEFVPTPGADIDDDRTEANRPKYSATGDIAWTNGALTLNYGVNWFSKTRRFPTEITDANPDRVEERYKWYKAYWEHQAQAAYRVDDRMSVYLGVNNLLDTKPDVAAAGYPQSAVGRSFYAGVRVKAF